MNPNINAESKNIKNGDLVKWRTWDACGIVIDDFNSHTVKIFWFDSGEAQWEQRTNVEVISES